MASARSARRVRPRAPPRARRTVRPRRLRRPRGRPAAGWRRRRARDGGYGNAIAAPLYFRHSASLGHDTGAHPERPERILALEAALTERDWLGYEVREARAATDEALLAVHTQSHLDAVREHCEAGVAFDADTPVGAGSLEAALHAAGGACALVDALLGGEAATAFCATRPPGHHAERGRAMGFCLFSNVAVAARHALAAHGVERVLILDWDVHHGNGTAAAFHAVAEVLYASIHQWPFYPGTGASADAGAGAGEGYTLNLPVPAGAGEDEWLGVVEHLVVPVARSFAPDLVLVSAGFDAHREDPLADCRLEAVSFAHMARHVHALARELGVPAGAVLEGGYDTGALAASAMATMEALAEGGQPRSVEPGALVAALAESVGRHWTLGA